MHCESVEMGRAITSTVFSHDKDKHIALLPNVLLSQQDEIPPDNGTAIEQEGAESVGSPSGGHRERCSVFHVS